MAITILTSEPIMDELPIVIITIRTLDNQTSIFAEYFICLHTDKEQHYFPMRMSCPTSEALRTQFGIDEEFVTRVALQTAQAKLDNYLHTRYEETKNRIFLEKRFCLQRADQSELIALCMRGFFQQQFKFILNHTKSSELARLLINLSYLRPIVFDDRF